MVSEKEARNVVGNNGLLEALLCRDMNKALGSKRLKCCEVNRSPKPLLRRRNTITGKEGLILDKISIKDRFRPTGDGKTRFKKHTFRRLLHYTPCECSKPTVIQDRVSLYVMKATKSMG